MAIAKPNRQLVLRASLKDGSTWNLVPGAHPSMVCRANDGAEADRAATVATIVRLAERSWRRWLSMYLGTSLAGRGWCPSPLILMIWGPRWDRCYP